jgi:outer membrane biogenesis lipoprotein LolB
MRERARLAAAAAAAAAVFLLAACAQDQEQRKAETEDFAKAAAQAETQVAQQDHIRCQSYGKSGSEAYLECRLSLKNHRAEMHDRAR